MRKLDPQLTRSIQEWLDSPEEKRDIVAGATMLLQLNRNRALFNSIIRRPIHFQPKLVYELRKYLRMRLDNVAVADAARIEQEIIPAVAETLATPPVISSDDELPEPVVARGKRPDHDSLPPEIRELWESNGQRYQQIRLLFNELKAMSDAQPCDRYERVKILGELDAKYRKNLKMYDEFVLPQHPDAPVVDADDADASVDDSVKLRLNAARKSLSKYKKILLESSEDDRRAEAAAKIQDAVDVIYGLGFGVSPETVAVLSQSGISFPVSGEPHA